MTFKELQAELQKLKEDSTSATNELVDTLKSANGIVTLLVSSGMERKAILAIPAVKSALEDFGIKGKSDRTPRLASVIKVVIDEKPEHEWNASEIVSAVKGKNAQITDKETGKPRPATDKDITSTLEANAKSKIPWWQTTGKGAQMKFRSNTKKS